MGARKRNRAEERKQEKKAIISARLNNCPSSPRKMRLVADMIRGIEVNRALDLLKHSTKSASKNMEKLVMSAVSNWQLKNENIRLEDNKLIIKEISVNQGRTLKRIRPAPQGRAYRIRKRSNHVTVILGNYDAEVENVQVTSTENQNTKN